METIKTAYDEVKKALPNPEGMERWDIHEDASKQKSIKASPDEIWVYVI